MKQQQIESTFFNMLSLHHQIVNNINFTEKSLMNQTKTTHSGREAISRLKDIYEWRYSKRELLKEHPHLDKNIGMSKDTEKKFKEKLFGNVDT